MITQSGIMENVATGVTNQELAALIAKAKTHIMTPEEVEEQRINFAFGNVQLHNPNVTEEMVREAAKRLRD